jgi:hypothetical protein
MYGNGIFLIGLKDHLQGILKRNEGRVAFLHHESLQEQSYKRRPVLTLKRGSQVGASASRIFDVNATCSTPPKCSRFRHFRRPFPACNTPSLPSPRPLTGDLFWLLDLWAQNGLLSIYPCVAGFAVYMGRGPQTSFMLASPLTLPSLSSTVFFLSS